jgi:hypothetical protein
MFVWEIIFVMALFSIEEFFFIPGKFNTLEPDDIVLFLWY